MSKQILGLVLGLAFSISAGSASATDPYCPWEDEDVPECAKEKKEKKEKKDKYNDSGKKEKGNNGFGNGPCDGIPGNSAKTGKTDSDR